MTASTKGDNSHCRAHLDMVREFHNVYGLPIATHPTLGTPKEQELRVELIQEELTELADALADGDLVEVLDALCDLQYVVDGAFWTFGFGQAKDEAMTEVHRSNLSKLDENGEVIYAPTGKVLKGPHFSPPDLKPIIEFWSPT